MDQTVTMVTQVLSILVIPVGLWIARETLRHLANGPEEGFLSRLAELRLPAVLLWLALAGVFAGTPQMIVAVVASWVRALLPPASPILGPLGWPGPGLTIPLFVASYAITYVAARRVFNRQGQGTALARLGGAERTLIWMTVATFVYDAVSGISVWVLTLPIPILQRPLSQPGAQARLTLDAALLFVLGVLLFAFMGAAMGGWWPRPRDGQEGQLDRGDEDEQARL